MSYVCVQSYCYTIQSNISNKLENYLAGGMRFAESSISFMFSISIPNITWIRRKRIKRLRHYLSCKPSITASSLRFMCCHYHWHCRRHHMYDRMACITVTGVVFVCHSRVLTIRGQLCVVQCIPFRSNSMKRNSIWSMFKYMTAYSALANNVCLCLCACVCVCMLSIRSEKKKKDNSNRGYDAFADLPLSLIQLSIYFCLKHAFQIIFTVGFPSILISHSMLLFFCHEHIYAMKKFTHFAVVVVVGMNAAWFACVW